jgi:hypothetical protein
MRWLTRLPSVITPRNGPEFKRHIAPDRRTSKIRQIVGQVPERPESDGFPTAARPRNILQRSHKYMKNMDNNNVI